MGLVESYHRMATKPDEPGLPGLTAGLSLPLGVDEADQARIPEKGAVVVVANHPFAVLEVATLAGLLNRVRPDVRVMTNASLEDLPPLARQCIFVDTVQSDSSVSRQARREAVDWLKQGGMLALFPAGEASSLRWVQTQLGEPEWSETAAGLVRETGASVLPIYFCGRNSFRFQLLGMIHPKLRTAALVQEFIPEGGIRVEVRVGSAIHHDVIAGMSGHREAAAYLRSRTYLLAQRARKAWKPAISLPVIQFPARQHVAVGSMPELLAAAIARLDPKRCILRSGAMSVHLLKGSECPVLLHELGRLREITFRKVGEGTGRKLDLDHFDDYYWHILLWDEARKAVVGAYRVGYTPEILRTRGVRGLYTSTLFRYAPQWFEKVGPALELGRSFVRPEYQRQYSPLLLLWKAIATLVAQQPETPALFGAVSISNAYSRVSREMIYRYFESRRRDDELAAWVRPRRPFRPAPMWNWDSRSLVASFHHLDALSQPISDVETDGKGLPILLRQYAKVGGRLLGFNVDGKFSSVLDGLVLVDLRKTDPSVLDRYMGRAGATRFREHHKMGSTQ